MSELNALQDEFFAFWWSVHPVHATAVGIHTHDGELDRDDAASLFEEARHLREYLTLFERFTPADVGEEIDREILLGQIRWRLHEIEVVRSHERNPLHYLDGPLGALYLMAVRDYAPAEERAARAIERLSRLPAVFDEARENLTDPAPVFVQTAAAMARSGAVLLESVLPMYLGAALQDDPDEYSAWENARRAGAEALGAFARWLEDELAPRAGGDFALGQESFEARLRFLHGIDQSADEIEAFGRTLEAETRASLEALAREIEPGRDWRDLVETLKDEHPQADELIDAYAREMKRARDFVEERGLVTIPAGEELEVVPTPEFLRPLIPYAAYQPPAPHEVSRKGFFYVTPPPPETADRMLRDHAIHGIPITALHEAYPGHHLQLTRATQADTEPRRVFPTPVFAEGWALYCEELMWEEGFYSDPRVRLLQLKDLLWRACRVVVDVGLHVRGWSIDQAVDYMVEEAGLERANAEVEVRRYCVEPTQPLSYAVGRREILRLRQLAQERLGSRFDLRAFHDNLLSWGTIPPALILRTTF